MPYWFLITCVFLYSNLMKSPLLEREKKPPRPPAMWSCKSNLVLFPSWCTPSHKEQTMGNSNPTSPKCINSKLYAINWKLEELRTSSWTKQNLKQYSVMIKTRLARWNRERSNLCPCRRHKTLLYTSVSTFKFTIKSYKNAVNSFDFMVWVISMISCFHRNKACNYWKIKNLSTANSRYSC